MSAVLSIAFALLPIDSSTAPVDFDTQVMPILTKAGCNSGACHGSAAGRGGFHLSLYGSRPADDFAEITMALEGRRINRRTPDQSLLLKKPTEMLSHGGELRIVIDSPEYHLLTRWIAEGAKRRSLRKLTTFSLTAASDKPLSVGDTVRLSATAEFDDGSTVDVLPQTVILAADPGATQVDKSGVVAVKTPGQHLLLARFLDRVEPLEFIVPLREFSAGLMTLIAR